MQTNQIGAVNAAAKILGNQAALARALGITPVTVGQWLKPEQATGRGVPPKQCVRIEQLTGGKVTRRDLRPDDWQEIWPELADATASTPGQPPGPQPAPLPVASSHTGPERRKNVGVPCIDPDLERRAPPAAMLAGQGG